MDSTTLAAMAGVLGSLVGGSATVATAWLTQSTQSRRELTQLEMRKRETLYGEFIAECAKLLMDSFTHTLDAPEKLLPLYALVNRIRLCASQPVLAEAEHLLTRITEQYFSRNLTLEEIRDLARSEDADPLKTFRGGLPGGAQVDSRRTVIGRDVPNRCPECEASASLPGGMKRCRRLRPAEPQPRPDRRPRLAEPAGTRPCASNRSAGGRPGRPGAQSVPVGDGLRRGSPCDLS